MIAIGTSIYLRLVIPSDFDVLFEWENNQENWLISGTFEPFSKEMILDYVHSEQDINLTKQLRLMICEISTNKAIGAVDLFEYDSYNKRAGVGILIANTDNRGKGIGKESLALLIKFAKDDLKLHQLYCSMLENNLASKNLFLGLGFEYIGCKKEWVRSDTKWLNEWMFQLIIS